MKKLTDKEKVEAILNLLTDKNVGLLEKRGILQGENERFGALVFATNTFNKAYKIAKDRA